MRRRRIALRARKGNVFMEVLVGMLLLVGVLGAAGQSLLGALLVTTRTQSATVELLDSYSLTRWLAEKDLPPTQDDMPPGVSLDVVVEDTTTVLSLALKDGSSTVTTISLKAFEVGTHRPLRMYRRSN